MISPARSTYRDLRPVAGEHVCPTGICQIKHVPRSRALCHGCTARLTPRLAERLADAWNEGEPTRHYSAVLSVVITVVHLHVERERIVG